MAAHAHCVQGPILHICALKSPACQFCCRCFVCRHPGSSGLKPGLAENPASEALLSSQPFCAALVFVGKQCPLFSGTLSPLGFSLFFFFFLSLVFLPKRSLPWPRRTDQLVSGVGHHLPTWPGPSSESVQVAQSCPTLGDPIDCTVHGILQARILEWVAAFTFSRGSSQPRD